jgi:putative FmdB family regulatory protein
MPTYDFECECGNKEELLLSISNSQEEQLCSECGKPMTKKITGCAGFSMGTEKTIIKNHKNKYGNDTNNVPKSKDNGVRIYGRKKGHN